MNIARNLIITYRSAQQEIDTTLLDKLATQKDQNYSTEQTSWIFSDNSALIHTAPNCWSARDYIEFHKDNEQLRGRL